MAARIPYRQSEMDGVSWKSWRSMSGKRPQRAEEPLLSDFMRGLGDIAAMFAEDVKEFLIVRDLRQLSEKYGHSQPFEEWHHYSTDLNLLQFAVLHRRSAVVEYLFDKHDRLLELDLYVMQDYSQHAMDEKCCLMWADTETPNELCEKLVNHPLHMACWLGDLACLKALTKVKSQPYGPNRTTKMRLKTCLKSVSLITRPVTAPLLLPVKGRPLDLVVIPVSISCLRFLLGEILPLVSHTSDLLPTKVEGRDLSLHTACCIGCPKLVALLLIARRQDVHCQDGAGQTPLHLAVRCEHKDTIRLLLEHEADANASAALRPCHHLMFSGSGPPTQGSSVKLPDGMANLNLTDTDSKSLHGNRPEAANQPLTTLHVLVNKIVTTEPLFTCGLMEEDSSRKLTDYTQCDTVIATSADGFRKNYLQNLVSCLRLLLKAGADPNATCHGQNMLQVVLSIYTYPGTENAEFVFSVVSTFLEFGASLAPHNDLESLNHFLRRRVSVIECSDLQARFLRLFCDNGVDPDCMAKSFASSLPCDSPLWDRSLPFWTCLAQIMSVEVFSTLSDFHRHQFTDRNLNQSAPSSQKHDCKAALWKTQELGNCKV